MDEVVCYSDCGGTGVDPHGNTCIACNGSGYVERVAEEYCEACLNPMDCCDCGTQGDDD